jgi:hypothetical protein
MIGQSVAFGDKTFDVVKEFVYLGSLVTLKNDGSLEIQKRIWCKHMLFRAALTMIVGTSVTSNKIQNLQDLDPPGPAVGSETWLLT